LLTLILPFVVITSGAGLLQIRKRLKHQKKNKVLQFQTLLKLTLPSVVVISGAEIKIIMNEKRL